MTRALLTRGRKVCGSLEQSLPDVPGKIATVAVLDRKLGDVAAPPQFIEAHSAVDGAQPIGQFKNVAVGQQPPVQRDL